MTLWNLEDKKLEKCLSEWGNPDPERQTQYVLIYKWVLALK